MITVFGFFNSGDVVGPPLGDCVEVVFNSPGPKQTTVQYTLCGESEPITNTFGPYQSMPPICVVNNSWSFFGLGGVSIIGPCDSGDSGGGGPIPIDP